MPPAGGERVPVPSELSVRYTRGLETARGGYLSPSPGKPRPKAKAGEAMTQPWIEGRFEDGVLLTHLGAVDQLGPAGKPVADDLRNRLLRDRDDVGRRRAVRSGPVWGRGLPAQSAAGRSDDRGRHRDLQDGQPHPPTVRANGRAEIRDRHGRPARLPAGRISSTATTSFAASTWSCRSTCTFPAARRGRNRCSKG